MLPAFVIFIPLRVNITVLCKSTVMCIIRGHCTRSMVGEGVLIRWYILYYLPQISNFSISETHLSLRASTLFISDGSPFSFTKTMTEIISLDFFLHISKSFFISPIPLTFSPIFEGKMSLQTFQGQPPPEPNTLHLFFWSHNLSLFSASASGLLPLHCPLFPSHTLDLSLLLNKISITLTSTCKANLFLLFIKTTF